MLLRTIELEAPDRARLFQRAVIYETLVPLVTQGRASMEVVQQLARSLREHLSSVDAATVFDDYMQVVAKDVIHILKALEGISGNIGPECSTSVRMVLESRVGILLNVSQAVTMNPVWNEKAKGFLKMRAAWVEHGPSLEQRVAALKEDASLKHLEMAVESIPGWLEALPAGL